MFRSHFILVCALVFFLVVLQGCYAYRVEVQNPDPVTEQERKIAHSLFWGLYQSPQSIVAKDCVSNALDEVQFTTNLGYAFATVLTLGVWAPIDVEWRCGEKSSSDGSDAGEF